MADCRERVLRAAEECREDSVTFLNRLVSVDTSVVNQGQTGGEGRAQPFVADRLSKLGCEVDVFEPDNQRLEKYGVDFNPGRDYAGRPNVVGRLRGTGGGRSLILNGHIDTVPFEATAWTFPPLSGAVSGGWMYGRGTADMKAGLVAMISAVEAIVRAGVKLRGDVIIQSVVDEEGGGNGTLACVDRGYVADGAIITEGTDERIVVATRGVLNVEITVTGVSAHAAHKWSGVNAVEKMMKILAGLSELERTWLATKRHPLLPSPTITVGQIQGGIGATVVPNTCTVKCDVKLLPAEVDGRGSPEPVKREFEQWVQMIAAGDEWLRQHPPAIRWYSEVAPHELASTHELVRTVSAAASSVIGNATVAGLPGGSDARILQRAGKTPTLLFGPTGRAAHGADECVDLGSCARVVSVLALAALEWCS